MKKTNLGILILLCLCILFCGCDKGSGNDGDVGNNVFAKPQNLMTEEEYHTQLQHLLDTENFTTLDGNALGKIDELGDKFNEMIIYSGGEITECTGTKYYISNNGNDDNDGKSPETAWATLKKINNYRFNDGDLVLFERGGFWRGTIFAQSGISYSAYGTGFKPKFYCSIEGKSAGWTQTDDENIWVYNEKLSASDIGCIVFNAGAQGEAYAEKMENREKLKKDLQFTFMGGKSTGRPIDFKIYMYSTEGNPAERFDTIEFSVDNHQLSVANGAHDIAFNNLDLYFGIDGFWGTSLKNISMSYCCSSWVGGHYDANNVRYGGGSGAWRDCDGISFKYCRFYQQFDTSVTAQYRTDLDEASAIFKDFSVSHCIFEYCDTVLECFNQQPKKSDNCYKNLYFGYNFCRNGGYGFGTKPQQSAYIKADVGENCFYDSCMEYNLFDRPVLSTIKINGYTKASGKTELSFEHMPQLKNNIYIQKADKRFAIINKTDYKYNKQTYFDIEKTGIEHGSVYLFCE